MQHMYGNLFLDGCAEEGQLVVSKIAYIGATSSTGVLRSQSRGVLKT